MGTYILGVRENLGVNAACLFLVVVLAAACDSSGGGTCDPYACDDLCQSQGYPGGICSTGSCQCIGEGDSSTDMVADTPPDTAADAPADTSTGFSPTPGTTAEVDRTEPCDVSEHNEVRAAPQDPSLGQACFPNYDVWAPVVCGYIAPACTCDPSRCLPSEVTMSVNAGEICICLNPCTDQSEGATCGASGERRCIPVDDISGTQVFICGGL